MASKLPDVFKGLPKKKPRFDIISELPDDLSTKILKLLKPEDLGRCMKVSKSWRRISNNEELWEKHCSDFGIEYSDAQQFRNQSLISGRCALAEAWFDCRTSPAYNWMFNRGEFMKFTNIDPSEGMRADGTSILAYEEGQLTLRRLPDFKKPIRIKSKYLTNHFCFDVNGDFVALSKFNIIEVYKIGKKNSVHYHMVIAICNGRACQTTSDFKRFIRTNLVRSEVSFYVSMKDENLMFSIEGCLNVINLKGCYISYAGSGCYLEPFFISQITKHEAKLLNFDGKPVITLRCLSTIRQVLANKGFMVIEKDADLPYSILEIWDLVKHDILPSINIPTGTMLDIHPARGILYHTTSLGDSLVAVDLHTGKMLWHTKISTDSEVRWYTKMVCKRLIILQNSINLKEYHLLNAFSGKYFYKGILPCGFVQNAFDNFLVGSFNSIMIFRK